VDLGPDPAIFVINFQDTNKKLVLKKFFCELLFEGTHTSFFKNKKLKRSQSKFFLLFLIDDRRSGSGSISLLEDPDPYPRVPKTCASGGSGFGSGSATLHLWIYKI
jgi:hypothetical protein